MIFFPYGTDAPVYYWPYATVGLIVANIYAFIVFGSDPSGSWILEYGNGLHPDQWIGSGFMHADIFHLISNLIFFWTFGLIVEGKIGSLKFLVCYFLIMIGESAVEQLIMLGSTGGGSLGASSAIFGVMAMAAIWAPINNIQTFILVFPRYIRGDSDGTVDIPVIGFAAFFIGIEIFFAFFFVGSSLLHLGGVAFGLPLAILMLKFNLVDCEGWDIFSPPRESNLLTSKEKSVRIKKQAEKIDQQKQNREDKRLQEAADQIHEFLNDANLIGAYKLYEAMKPYGEGPPLATGDLVAMVRLLHKEKRYAESVPFMKQLIDREPEATHPMRVKLAHICVAQLERPSYALELLERTDRNRLKEEQRSLAKKIAAKAKGMQEEGVVELDMPIA